MTAEFPKMLYGDAGQTRVVATPEEEASLKGWSREPSASHLEPPRPMIQGGVPVAPLTEAHIPIIVEAVVAALMSATQPKSKKDT